MCAVFEDSSAGYYARRKCPERTLYRQFRRSLPRSGRSIMTAVSAMAVFGFMPRGGRMNVRPAAGSNGRMPRYDKPSQSGSAEPEGMCLHRRGSRLADFVCIPAAEIWLYPAAIIGLFSRK